jgi:hypothetical protein
MQGAASSIRRVALIVRMLSESDRNQRLTHQAHSVHLLLPATALSRAAGVVFIVAKLDVKAEGMS